MKILSFKIVGFTQLNRITTKNNYFKENVKGIYIEIIILKK